MKLQKLEIENFRSLKNFKLEMPLDSKGVVLMGKNGTGKSTIIDAIMWLLCDETFVYGCQNDDNLDKNNRNQPVNVSATFIKDNGDVLELKRTLTPKFTKTGEFSKYENALEINGADYTVKNYFLRIKNQELGIKIENDPDVSSFNTLRCILDYNYLDYVDYKTARAKIEKLLKITKDDELINRPEFAIIKDDLVAQLYDIAKVKSKFNKQKDVAEETLNVLNKNYEALKLAYKPIDTEELEKLEAQKKSVSEMEYEHSVEYKTAIQKNNEIQLKLKEAYNNYLFKETTYNNKLKEYNSIESNKDKYSTMIDNLMQQYVIVRDSSRKCPNCGYELNGDEIQKQLNELNEKGTNCNKEIENCDKLLNTFDLKKYEDDYKTAKSDYASLVKSSEELSAKLNEVIYKENEQSKIFYNEKASKMAEIEGKISALKSASNSKTLEEKEKELKVVRQDLAKTESKIAVIKEFEINKNKAITLRINEVFPNLDFRLFEESDTGTIKNTCKVYLKNVGYEGINTGHKIMIGLEIINSLRKVLGVTESLPIIFDNVSDLDFDNFNNLIKNTNNQIITACAKNVDNIEYQFIK